MDGASKKRKKIENMGKKIDKLIERKDKKSLKPVRSRKEKFNIVIGKIKGMVFKKMKFKIRNLEYKLKRLCDLAGTDIKDLVDDKEIKGLTLFKKQLNE